MKKLLFCIVCFVAFSINAQIDSTKYEVNLEYIVYLKKLPTVGSERIDKIQPGEKVRFLGYENKHNKVLFKKQVGYIDDFEITEKMNPFISKIKDSLKFIEEDAKLKEYKENCNYIENNVDEYDGSVKKLTNKYDVILLASNNNIYNADVFEIALRSINKAKYVYFYSNQEVGCASPYKTNRSQIKIKLENNDILTFFHHGDVDCGDFRLIGTISNEEIKRLKKSPIKSIRVYGTEYYHDVSYIDWTTFFQDKLKCID